MLVSKICVPVLHRHPHLMRNILLILTLKHQHYGLGKRKIIRKLLILVVGCLLGTISCKPVFTLHHRSISNYFVIRRPFRLVSKYRFDTCYRYNKDFRLLVASQSSLSLGQRTARWECLHTELSTMRLQQDTWIPSCFHCRNTGHFAPNCPMKNTGNNTFRNVAPSSQAFSSRLPIHQSIPAGADNGDNWVHS